MASGKTIAAASVSLLLAIGCDKQSAKSDPKAEPKVDDKADSKGDDEPRDEKAASFATPKTDPPPGPPGTITLPDPFLYVQTCAEPLPCPDLTQPAGDAHCRELRIGGHVNWRLPSK